MKLKFFFIVLISFTFLPVQNALATTPTITLSCMNQNIIDGVLLNQDISIATAACSDELIKKMFHVNFMLISDDMIEVILAMIVAHHAAPYGPSNSSTQYKDIIKEKNLNCGKQSVLMGYLLPQKNIHFLGFDGGAVGNHAQAMYVNQTTSLLLDPTTSVITEITYNELLQGKPAKQPILMHPNFKNTIDIKVNFTSKVISALLKGAYRPTDILYYYESLNHRLGKGPLDPYITPAGVGWRKKHKTLAQ